MKHFIHFLILALIIGGGILLFWSASGDRALQLFIGVLTALAYVTWGIAHHAVQHDLHRKVVVEYVLIGTMAVVLLLTILGS